jgi:hypothetical protein
MIAAQSMRGAPSMLISRTDILSFWAPRPNGKASRRPMINQFVRQMDLNF